MRLHDLVAEAALRDPLALAVEGGDGSLSYGELHELADRFAAALLGRGVAAGDRVVLWSGKSALAVAFMQGALRAGAVYVPVTEGNPAARVHRIAADCGASLIVADGDALIRSGPDLYQQQEQGDRPDAAGPAGDPPVALADLLAEVPAAGTGTMHPAGPDDPAYILYTSGSTGAPKGVCLSHRNALAFVEWAVRVLDVTAGDRLSNHAPFNFDLSVFDLYAAFRAGASVHLVPAEMAYAPAQLARFVRERRISVWYSVPSALALMMREGGLLDGDPPPSLRACVFAGEPFPLPQVQALRKSWPGVRMLNWYGPTETNVCTSYEVTEADLGRTGALPIGTAAAGDTVTLDPPGAQGEIVVSGPTVMLGYWGRPPQAGPYRTGDIGRYDAQGNLEYAGRIDHMVKLRGHRVEPGEIEAVLAAHPAIDAVSVVVVGDGLDARLHAVAVPAGAARPRLLGLKQFAALRLPTYMLPDVLHVVGALPLTANGKVDRAALLAAIDRAEL